MEWECLSQFRDVNGFTERLVPSRGKDISAMSTMMQLAGVIATERLAHDVHTVEGRANLVREFAGEYATLQELAAMAEAAGVPQSVRYDPQLGAIHSATA